MTKSVSHNQGMQAFNVAEAKAHLSEILEAVSAGEEVVLTKRGKAVARITPLEQTSSILGSGKDDPNINRDVLAADRWHKAMADDEAKLWYE